MGDDVLAEQPQGFHHLFVADRPHLEQRHDLIDAHALVVLDVLDAVVRVADAEAPAVLNERTGGHLVGAGGVGVHGPLVVPLVVLRHAGRVVPLPDVGVAYALLLPVPVDDGFGALKGFLPVFHAEAHGVAGDAGIYQFGGRFGIRDSVPVDSDEVLGPVQADAGLRQAAQSLASHLFGGEFLADRLPDWRMRFLHGLGDDLPGRNVVVLALEGEGLFRPGSGDDLQVLFDHFRYVGQVGAVGHHLVGIARAADAEVNAAAGQHVQRGHA